MPSDLDLLDQYFVVFWKNLRLSYWISFYGNWDLISGTRQAQNTVWQRVGLAQNLGGAHTQQLSLARARPGDHQE